MKGLLKLRTGALLLALLVGAGVPALIGQPNAPAAAAPQGLDSLTAPIALYPDALVAQILMASTNVSVLQAFAAWLGKNSNLKGSELQDAADQAGFDACYVALAPFPQVVEMLVQKPDWTAQLGQAFTNNRDQVFESIQRLRAQAQSVGNLKSSPQQEVQTQTTSSGQQVIVIQPANPQVVYVPQYNPQTVYVTAAPPSPSPYAAAAVGFTMGIVIGHASSHYYGPYGWHGAALYHEAWEDRYDYLEDRQENRQDFYEDNKGAMQENRSQRQSNYQGNQDQRQTNRQANQDQRQTNRQANQDQRQTGRQTNQSQRQSTGQAGQARTQTAQAQRQPQSVARPSSTQSGGWQGQRSSQTAAATSSRGSYQAPSQRSGMSSGGFSGYQSGSATRQQQSRGSGSLASSRGGGGRSGGGGRRR
jgi:hypothetical protein